MSLSWLYFVIFSFFCFVFFSFLFSKFQWLIFWVLFWFASLRCFSKKGRRKKKNYTVLILSLVIADINYCYYLFLLFDLTFIVEYFSNTDKKRPVQLCTLKTITVVVCGLLFVSLIHKAYRRPECPIFMWYLFWLFKCDGGFERNSLQSLTKKERNSSCLHLFRYLLPGSSSQF